MEKFRKQVKQDMKNEDDKFEKLFKEKGDLENKIEELKLEVSKVNTKLKNIMKDLNFEKNSVKRFLLV